MNFQNFTEESEFIQKLQKRSQTLLNFFKAREENVHLADPQKRLEEILQKMFNSTDTDSENVEKMFKSRLEELELKLAESNHQIYTNILALANNTENHFEMLKEELGNTNERFTENFKNIQTGFKNQSGPVKEIEPRVNKKAGNYFLNLF